MSFREKSAWLSLLTTIGVWGYYLLGLIPNLTSGDPDGGAALGLFLRCVAAVVVIQVAIAIVLALQSPAEADAPADERERLIAMKASRIAYPVLALLVATTLIGIPFLSVGSPLPFGGDPLDDSLLLIGSAIFLALVIADIVHAGTQIFYFRRGD
jgi:hypothetical protein